MDPWVICDETTGALELSKGHDEPEDKTEDTIGELQERADQIVHGLEGLLDKRQTPEEFDKERQTLYQHIEGLNEQVRQVLQAARRSQF